MLNLGQCSFSLRRLLRGARVGFVGMLSMTLAISGCASTARLQSPSSSQVTNAVRVGDRVEITDNTGKKFQFVVTSVTRDALNGDAGATVPISSIATLERNGKRGGMAAGIGAGVVAVIALGVIFTVGLFEAFTGGR